MFPTKAPGSDGFYTHLFIKHQEICGKEVTLEVIQVLKGEEDVREIN
jgi:hypothetical protein